VASEAQEMAGAITRAFNTRVCWIALRGLWRELIEHGVGFSTSLNWFSAAKRF